MATLRGCLLAAYAFGFHGIEHLYAVTNLCALGAVSFSVFAMLDELVQPASAHIGVVSDGIAMRAA